MSGLSQSDWIEVVVPTSVALADAVADHLIQTVSAASLGVQVRKADVVLWAKASEAQLVLREVRECVAGLRQSGWEIDESEVRLGLQENEATWRDAWKEHFRTTRLTRQLVIVPSWEYYEQKPEDLVIRLDPGQAFGTGLHASTQLVLDALQQMVDIGEAQPQRVFDLGCGSGILAIAATKFWPNCSVTATDIDEPAIHATKDNAQKNGVAEQISASTTPLSKVDGSFPLILANLQAHILRSLTEELIPCLTLRGRLIVSGVLSNQMDSLLAYMGGFGLKTDWVHTSRANPDWSAAQVRRVAL